MIRAHRVNATAQDDARLISGWNVSPNVSYTVTLLPGAISCGVLLYTDGVLVASGAALAGTDQPCALLPQSGYALGMVDVELGWHLMLTTTGTESQRTIRINPAVDLPDDIHPIYGDDDLALVRATAGINVAAHYLDDVTVSCPLGLGAGLGDVVSVPVDGSAVIGEVESITWTATPDGVSDQAVIRRYVAIAPEAFVEPVPPMVADDAETTTHLAEASGNVLANDDTGLSVTAVNGLSGNVGSAVDGDNGGSFTLNSDGSWTFDPDGDFALLEGSETADTSVTYHASDGAAEAMAILTVTVSHANAAPVAVDDTGETDAATTTSGNVLTNDTDDDGGTLTVSQVAGSASNVGENVAGSSGGLFTIGADGTWTFDPNGDFASLAGEETETTNITYHVSDGLAEDEGMLTVTVSASATPADWTPAEITTAIWLDTGDIDGVVLDGSAITQFLDKSGANRHLSQSSASLRPALTLQLNDQSAAAFSADYVLSDGNFPVVGDVGFSVFWVLKKDSLGRGSCFGWGVNGTLTLAGVYDDGTNAWFAYGGGQAFKMPQITAGSWNIFSYIKAAGPIGANSKMYKNGASFEASGHSTATPNISNGRFYLGTWGNSGVASTLIGGFAEMIVVPVATTAATANKIEGYLAHKWGLTANLPSDHPYKYDAPTI